MAATEYRQVLEHARRLTPEEQARLVKKLAAHLAKSGGRVDLSKVEGAVAYVEGDARGRIAPREWPFEDAEGVYSKT